MTNLLKKRFTGALIQEMAETLANRSFKQKLKDQENLLKNMALAIYNEVYPKEERDLMATLPEGWLSKDSGAYLRTETDNEFRYDEYIDPHRRRHHNDPNKQIRLYQSTALWVEFPEKLPIKANNVSCSGNGLLANAEMPVVKAYLEGLDQLAKLKADNENFNKEMQNVLRAHGNFETLYHYWPQVRELLDIYEPVEISKAAKALPPALPLDLLNAQLEIPTEKTMTATA